MSAAFHIRPFSPADQPATKTLIQAGLGEHFGWINPDLNPDLSDIWRTYVASGQTFVVVEMAGELVGTGALIQETLETSKVSSHQRLQTSEVCGRLVRMSVSQAHRRLGIGRALVLHLIEKARERRFGRLLVETNLDWYDAIGLYQHCGFVEYARDEESIHLSMSLLQSDSPFS